jgi:hypothetical protein
VYTGFWRGNLEGRGQMEDLGVNGRVILKRVLKKNRMRGYRLD